jgi:hypothetical protein
LVKHHLAQKSIGQSIGQTSFGPKVNWSNIIWPKSQLLKHHLAKKSMGQTSFGQRVNLSNIIWPKSQLVNIIWLYVNWSNTIWPKSQLDKHHLAKMSIWLNIVWPKSQLDKHHLAQKSIGQTSFGQKSNGEISFGQKSQLVNRHLAKYNWSHPFYQK